MRLLLLSNSTNAGEGYLEYPIEQIKQFLGPTPVKCLFIPYAAVSITYDDFTAMVRRRFEVAGHMIDPIHQHPNPSEAVKMAQAIVVGGGNTFQLNKFIQENNLIQITRDKVHSGTAYIGWSAGANVA